MARSRRESHHSDGITVHKNRQRLLQQNLPEADITANDILSTPQNVRL